MWYAKTWLSVKIKSYAKRKNGVKNSHIHCAGRYFVKIKSVMPRVERIYFPNFKTFMQKNEPTETNGVLFWGH